MWRTELNRVAEIAREAGRVLLEVYAGDFAVEWKGKSDPVTEADRRADTLIVSRLREAFPDDGIIAEESAGSHGALERNRIWYVDPLDGTKEFIAKNGEFSVMIGLAVDGRAQLGVVFQPSTDVLYAGAVGRGAWVEREAVRTELVVSRKTQTNQLGLIVSRSHRPAKTEQLIQRLGIQRETPSERLGRLRARSDLGGRRRPDDRSRGRRDHLRPRRRADAPRPARL
jgi:3'(2'), 5'-bisphosphate nucleotidase